MRHSVMRRRWGIIVTIALLLAGLLVPVASGDPPDRVPLPDPAETLRVIVELNGAPLADDSRPVQVARVATEQASLRVRLKNSGIPYRELSSFQKLFNGVTLSIRKQDLGRVGQLPGVKRVHIASRINAPIPQLASSTRMIGANQAWAGDPSLALPGINGTGVVVAIVDTGVDYTHPDLGGCLGPSCKIIYGYDFAGDRFNGINDPVPDTDPMDQIGHGTHVAGIIGAKAASVAGVTGVAPGVSLVSLKVFGPEGSTWDDLILQALERAYDLKVDVVNLSIGAAFLWPQSPTAQAVTRLYNKGVLVASSIGNNGGMGDYAGGAPGVGTGAIAAASVENEFLLRHAFLDPASTPIGYETMVLSPPPPSTGKSAELVFAGLGVTDQDFQNPDGTSKVDGKIALIKRGAISFLEKSLRAQDHGAVGAIIFNNAAGWFSGTLQVPGDYIPTIGISQADGVHLLDLMAAGPVTVTWTEQMYQFPNETARQISPFSSQGPAPDLSVKPDVTAPGGFIYSTYPVKLGSYATMSGTSMASPHVAGALALVIQGRRELTAQGSPAVKPSGIRTLLMNTAAPLPVDANSEKLNPVNLQGAGLIDAWKAITAKQRIQPEKISLGEVKAGDKVTQDLVIENLGDTAETYRFEAISAAGAPVTLAVAVTPFTVQPRTTRKSTMTLTIPADLPDGALFSGWIRVRNSADAVVAHLPYLGFKGEYHAASALDPIAPFNFPWLAKLSGIFLLKATAVEMHPGCDCDQEAAWIVFSLARQARLIRVEIWEPSTGRKWGNYFEIEYTGRSAGGIEIIPWDGTNDKGRMVPPGTYVLRLMVLKPLGYAGNAADWDIWVSGPITVIY